MAITTIFGINGVGKDTVANSLRTNNPDLLVTSISRMLMYILGITKTYDVNEKVCEEQYKMLESVPQEKMIKIENTDYKDMLDEIASSKEDLIMLSHLISALRHGDKIQYLTDRTTPDWYVKLNQALIQLVAPSDIVSYRRKNDVNRKRETSIEEIEYHQSLCTNEWERIKRVNPDTTNRMFIVNNINLSDATNEIEQIMHNQAKVLRKIRSDK
ncbi:MAG: hypothetical protein UE699_02930 [Bacilli bacterium]|nr:hypothetical protein [Bacilli bacterium]